MFQPSKPAVILKFYSQKTSLNKQGWNSIHKQSKWKASWRNSLTLDSTFKASCYIEILFTKHTLKKRGKNSQTEQMKGVMKELYMAHRFWYSLWYLFIFFTVEHNLLNVLNVEANSDFYLKFHFFGIFELFYLLHWEIGSQFPAFYFTV